MYLYGSHQKMDIFENYHKNLGKDLYLCTFEPVEERFSHLFKKIIVLTESMYYKVKNCSYEYEKNRFRTECFKMSKKNKDDFPICIKPLQSIILDTYDLVEFLSDNVVVVYRHDIKMKNADHPKKHFPNLEQNVRSEIFRKLFGNKVHDINVLTSSSLDVSENDVLCLVTNTVHVGISQEPFISIYSSEERFKQLLHGCESIRRTIPNSKIIVLENSPLSIREIFEIQKVSDYLILFERDQYSKGLMVKSGPSGSIKNIGETYLLKKFMETVPKLKFSWLVKISGRYKLHHLFNISDFLKEKPVGKVISREISSDGTQCMTSVIYSIPYKYINLYIETISTMHGMLTSQYSGISQDIEHLLFFLLGEGNIIDVKQSNVISYHSNGSYQLL